MARRKKGDPVSGWVVIDKPAGWGSTQIVGKVRWAFNAQKAGHAGTLDPAATGVLAVALGEATKTIPFITDALKAYRFTVRWGAVTSSDDAEGEVLERFDARPERFAIEAALPGFTGDIMQVPPRVSAVKVDGARAYDLAREDEAFELKARPLFVESLALIDLPDTDTAVFEMVCGKGGYVRSIARDLGQVLGCGGHVLTLRRLWSGPFDAAQGTGPEEIDTLARTPELRTHLLPVEAALHDIPEARLTAEGAVRILNGNPGAVSSTNAEYGETAWGSANGKALAIGTYMGGVLHPNRVLNQV